MNLKVMLMQEEGWNIDYFPPSELEVSLILLTEETVSDSKCHLHHCVG